MEEVRPGTVAPRDPRWVVLDTVPSMLAYWDSDLRCRYANRAYEAWFGVDPEALLGRHLRELLGPTLFALNEPYARAALDGLPQTFEREIPGPGGNIRRSLTHYLPDVVDGKTVGMVVQATDVRPLHEARTALLAQAAEREQALIRLRDQDAALRASAARLQATFDAMNEGLVLHRQDGQIIDANPAAERILGLSRDQLLGRCPMDPRWQVVREDGSPFPGVDHPASVTLRSGRSVRGQIMGIHAPGCGTRWLSVNAVPVRDADDPADPPPSKAPAQAVVATFVDITDLHVARQRLDALVQDQHAMLDNDLVGIVRLRGLVAVWHNGALARMFGHADGGLLGQAAWTLLPEGASSRAVQIATRRVVRGGGRYRRQLELLRRDGARLWVDVSGSALAPDSGESLWILNDISPMKRAEAQQLEAVRLAAENTQVREASRLKSLFIANMSHELRTPLNAVLGLAGLLETGTVPPGSPEHRHYLAQIGTSGRHLLQMIDDVLTLSSSEAGRLQFEPQAVQPAALAREAVDLLEPEAAAKGIRIEWHVEPALPTLHLDPLRIKQVMVNYLSNAVKFTPPGGRVSMRLLTDGKRRWRLEVEDTGIGIAPEDHAVVFAEFRQLSAGATKRYPGAGLGLAVTRSLVEAQGGRVGVVSAPGSGSVFYAVLPRPSH